MKKMKMFLGIGTLLVILVSCGTTAMVQKDNNVDIRKFRTYAWVDASTQDTLNKSSKTNDLMDRKNLKKVSSVI
jgi:ABC-type glycerol-3-phosphate transport system substrate-binding protein